MGDNHDMDRLFMQLKRDVAPAEDGADHLLSPSAVFPRFYGDEIFDGQYPHHKNDGLIPFRFPGGWKGDTVKCLHRRRSRAPARAVQAFLKQLPQLGGHNPVIAMGAPAAPCWRPFSTILGMTAREP